MKKQLFFYFLLFSISSFAINPPCNINVITSHTDASCYGSKDGAATATPIGGNSPYAYSWSGLTDTIADVSGLSSGTYTVTATDASSCTASATVFIGEPASISISASSISTTCNEANGTAAVTASGGAGSYSYSWSNGDGGPVISYVASGTYTVTVSDINLCTATQSVTVGASIKLQLTVSRSNSHCNKNDGSATVSVTAGGIAPYRYNWSTGDTTPTISGLYSGIYFVDVEDSVGCKNYATAIINDLGAPTIVVDQFVPETCMGQNGSINITATGAGPLTYAWSNGASTDDISALYSGSYEVYVVDKNFCQAIESINITQITRPALSYTSTDANCAATDGSASVSVSSGGQSPFVYSWSNGTTTANATGLAAGSYVAYVTDQGGCKDSLFVNINSIGGASVYISSVTAADCINGGGGAIDISVSGGTSPFSYSWSNGSISEDLSGINQGTYVVNVVDSNGCVASLTVDVFSPAPSGISLCVLTVDSTNRNVVVWERPSGSGIKKFNIYRESTQANIYQYIGSTPANQECAYRDATADATKRSFRYKISVVDSCDNESTQSSEHKTMHLVVNKGTQNNMNLSWDAYEGVSYSSYIIYKGYSPDPSQMWVIDTIPSNLLYYTDTTTVKNIYYAVAFEIPVCDPTAKSFNDSKSNTAVFSEAVGIIQYLNPHKDFEVFPNPTSGQFNIITGQLPHELYVIDMQGKTVYSHKGSEGTIKIDLSGMARGLYTVQLLNAQGRSVKRITIQ